MKLLGKIIILFIALSNWLGMAANAQRNDAVRKSVVAGQFFSSDPLVLRRDIDKYLSGASKFESDGQIIGISVPHAGYVYSAAVAAAGYKQAEDLNPDIVVILAPSHREYFRGATIFPGKSYETPLGAIEIDRPTADALVAEQPLFQLSEKGHGLEHAIEVQIPFIQTVFPNSKIVPIVIGDYDWLSCEKMGKAIAHLVKGRKAFLVASTDLYHGESYAACQRIDNATLAAITQMAPRNLCQGLIQGTYQACGGAPVVVLQVAAQALGTISARLLKQTNSNDVTGQKNGYVVGYGAVAYYTSKIENDRKQTFKPLSRPVQAELLRMARESIKYYLKEKKIPLFNPEDALLKEQRGVFVTLTKRGELRGCIGYHEADRPLYQLVPDRAVAAAFSDPRFPPLQFNELDQIVIKISVYLTNVYQAQSLDEFVMGKHGIIMLKDGRGATYLPEVPLEAGWKTRREEMESLCQKAGLDRDAWKEGAQFFLYETQVFDETQFKH